MSLQQSRWKSRTVIRSIPFLPSSLSKIGEGKETSDPSFTPHSYTNSHVCPCRQPHPQRMFVVANYEEKERELVYVIFRAFCHSSRKNTAIGKKRNVISGTEKKRQRLHAFNTHPDAGIGPFSFDKSNHATGRHQSKKGRRQHPSPSNTSTNQHQSPATLPPHLGFMSVEKQRADQERTKGLSGVCHGDTPLRHFTHSNPTTGYQTRISPP